MIDGFKKFISRGNMIDMAVGVVMGGAVTAVVNAIVNSVINPLIAMIFGKPNMDGLLAITFNGATISFGAVLGSLLNFLVIAVAVYFCILVPINKLRDMSEALLSKAKISAVLGGDHAEAGESSSADKTAKTDDSDALTPEQQTVVLLQQIRDELTARRESASSTGSAASATEEAQ